MDDSNKNTSITRLQHFLYVQAVCIFIWTALTVMLSCLFPVYSNSGGWRDVGAAVNINLWWFIPPGIIFGLVSGVILNKWALADYSDSSYAKYVPVTRPAGYGKKLLGWRGLVFLGVLAWAYIGCGHLRKQHYLSAIAGKEPAEVKSYPWIIRAWVYRTELKADETRRRFNAVNSLIRLGQRGKKILLAEFPGGEKEAKFLIENWSRRNKNQPQKGEPVLHAAARQEFIHSIEILLEGGANINSVSDKGKTPLHVAVENGKVKSVILLITRGADVNMANLFSETPLDIAENKGHTEIAEFLRYRGGKSGKE
ncbi:MAG: ankyrin repeat domain-containing protein [Planctomycetota bacterium]|nr:MAG: ankyrin repeat domain-containing protein [Planctomycetota bacterium]